MNTRTARLVGISGAALGVALGLAACGDAFSSGDCASNRTCPPTQAQGGTGADGAGGGDAMAGALDTGGGGAGGAGAGENAAPTVVSVSPENEADAVEPDSQVVIEFSEPLDEATVTAANIQVLEGDEPIAGDLSYADGKVTFSPEVPLKLLKQYGVAVSVAVTDGEGAPFREPFRSTFTVREGVWSITTPIAGPVGGLPTDLPFSAAGEVLLTWPSSSSGPCSPMARWFNRGKPAGPEKVLSTRALVACGAIRADAVAPGQLVLSWGDDGRSYTARFKNGKWEASQPVPGATNAGWFESKAGPDGVMHHLESINQTGLLAYVSDPAGVWSSGPFTIDTNEDVSESPGLAIANNGRAVAAWPSRDATEHPKMSFATYSPRNRTWGKAATVPGSLAASTNVIRGRMSLAFDQDGEAMLLWIGDNFQVMANRSRLGVSTWEQPVDISGSLGPQPHHVRPELVFDGTTFVAAWTKPVGTAHHVFVARYDMENDTWGAFQQVSDAKTAATARMPMLDVLADQDLSLTWIAPTGTPNVSGLVHQRYAADEGKWGAPQPIDGATLVGERLASDTAWVAHGASPHGRLALTWGDFFVGEGFGPVHLASLH